MFKYCFIGCIFLSHFIVQAKDADQARFWSFPKEHPLNFAAVLDMKVGPKGFVWLATESGLIRYDGKEAKRYSRTMDNVHNLPANTLEFLRWSNDGILWIGTQSHDLIRFDPRTETFQPISLEEENPTKVGSLYIDATNTVWVGNSSGNLYWIDTKTLAITKAKLPNPERVSVRTIEADQHGNVWVGMNGNGIVRFGPDRKIINHWRHEGSADDVLPNNNIRTSFLDAQGRMWFGTIENGVFYYDEQSQTFERPFRSQALAGAHIVAIQQDDFGALWFAC